MEAIGQTGTIAGEAPLGRDADISSLIDFEGISVDASTGEVVRSEVVRDPSSVRLERFALQSAARRILPNSRTAKCLRFRQADKTAVEVWRSRQHKTASFGGLQTCASVWACPVCSAKISERRRVELSDAIAQHEASGGRVLLITLTNPHEYGDDLGELLKAQTKAMSRWAGMKMSKAFRDWLGLVGTVRAWEVTHGQHGWHPHFHLLAFVTQERDLGEIKARAYQVWASACRLAGLPAPSFAHGVDVRGGADAADYVAKFGKGEPKKENGWGLEHEMTKGHIKRAKIGGRTPFDLLRSYLYDDDRQAGALFAEYANAFHGKHQLEPSKGFKDLFKESDEEVAARQEHNAELLGKIEFEDWRRVLAFDLRGEVLELARHGWEPVERLLDGLRNSQALRSSGGLGAAPPVLAPCASRGQMLRDSLSKYRCNDLGGC